MAVAKAPLLGIVAITAIAIPVGLYFAGVFNSEKGTTISVTTIFEKDNSSYTDKFGSDFARHFASATDKDNKAWWDHVFKTRWNAAQLTAGNAAQTSQRSAEFTSITKGWGESNSDENNSLNKVCEAAYKKATTEIHDPEGTTNTKVKYEEDVWKYCSISGILPVTIAKSKATEENEYRNGEASGTTKIGKAKNKSLISAEGTANDLFWAIQEEAFFNDAGFGQTLTSESQSTSFKTLYESKGKSGRSTLKSTCKTAYTKDTNSTQEQTNAMKFCSLSGKKSS